MSEVRLTDPTFRDWIESSLRNGVHVLATSNQGTLLRYQESGADWVVKAAMGNAFMLRTRLATLRREYEAYQRLDGLAGVPRCLGMVDERYLVLEYISGTPYRHAQFADRAAWFDEFFRIIQGFHQRGVSHGDLKSKSNIVVTDKGHPCVIDFGTGFVLREGFHPINNALFRYSQRLDLNAWVKHKYHGRYEDVSEEDRQWLNYSRLERYLRKRRPQ